MLYLYSAMIEHGVDGFCTSVNDSVVKWHKKHALLQKPSSGDQDTLVYCIAWGRWFLIMSPGHTTRNSGTIFCRPAHYNCMYCPLIDCSFPCSMLALHNDSFGGKKLHVFSKNWYGLKEFSKKDFSALRILITYKLEINK